MSEPNVYVRGMVGVKLQAVEQAAVAAPCIDFVASTGIMDRYGEVVEPGGWRLERYRENPVFQNAHRYGDVLYTLGRALVTEVREIDGKAALYQRIEFATEVSPQARIAYGLYRGGFLNAVSVGFIPLRWEEGQKEGEPVRRYVEQELLEVSAVAVPANSEALAMGLKSGYVEREDVAFMLRTLGFGKKGPEGTDIGMLRRLARALGR